MPPQNIETPRLLLRPPTLGDAEAIFCDYAQDPEVVRYLIWRPHTSIQDTNVFLRKCIRNWSDGSAFAWALVLKANDKLVGMIELRIDGHKADVGYVLARLYWGQGYMAEAAGEIIRWAMAQDSIYRVWAVSDVENKASCRVLEKAGMKCEGILRRWLVHPNVSSEPRDGACYAITK